jgi:sugar phosphate isomerase/epimerase
MARLSINEITTFRWTFDEDVQNYAVHGITGIGVWRQKLSDFGEEKAVELLADTGMSVSSLLWAGGFTGSDGRSYRDSVADAVEAVHLAAELRAGSLVVYSGSRCGHTHSHARRLFRSALQELVPVAAGRGVALAVEPMHPDCAADWTFLTDVDAALGLLAALSSPTLKLVFDTYHLGQDPAILGRLPELVPWIGLVQLGDARQPPRGEQNRCRLGEGTVPLREIIATLRASGYDGFFEVELLGEDLGPTDYGQLIDDSQHAFAALAGGVAQPG